MTSPAGVTVNPYEGVLQLASGDCCHPLAPFESPQFGVLTHGESSLLDVRVLAETVAFGTGALRGVVWATWFVRGTDVAATVGITVRGFDAAGRYVGVTPGDVRLFRSFLARWAKEGRMPAALSELGTQNALRFNQGDAFFSKKLGHACSATPPGEAELPMLYHAQRRESLEPHIVRRDPAPAAPRPKKKKPKAGASKKGGRPPVKSAPARRAA